MYFQTQGAFEAEQAYIALTSYTKSLKERVYTNSLDQPAPQKKRAEQIDLGTSFINICDEHSRGMGEEVQMKMKDAKNRAWAFLLRVVEEVEKRLPSNLEVFKQITFFRPSSIFSKRLSDMPYMACLEEKKIDDIEEEFRQFKLVDWKANFESKGLEGLPKDPVTFWSQVLKYRHSCDVETQDPDNPELPKPFVNLAEFVLGRYTLAHSTAAVERIFSIVNVVKTKQRNRLKTKMLESILRVRSFLYARGKCCATMSVTHEMVSLFNNSMYNTNQGLSLEEEQDFNSD